MLAESPDVPNLRAHNRSPKRIFVRMQVTCIEGRQLNMIVNHDPVAVNGDTINRHVFKDRI